MLSTSKPNPTLILEAKRYNASCKKNIGCAKTRQLRVDSKYVHRNSANSLTCGKQRWVGKESGINIIKLAKKNPVTKQPITINKQATKQIVTIGKSLSRDLGIPVSVVLFVAWQLLRVFRTSYEAAAIARLFLIKIGEIMVRNHSKYLLNHLFF